MDAHLWWFRRWTMDQVFRSLLVTFVVVSTVASVLLVARTDLRLLVIVPWALVIGQIAALVQVALAVTTNPLTFRYLRRFGAAPRRFATASDPDGHPHAAATEIRRFDLVDSGAVQDIADADLVFDLFQTPDQMVTAAIGRLTGSVALMTRTVDGRIIFTGDLRIPPHERLIAHRAPGGVEAIAREHRRALLDFAGVGVTPVPAETDVFAELMELEHDIYAELGPLVGCFADLAGTGSRYRLRFAVPAEDLLQLALAVSVRRRNPLAVEPDARASGGLAPISRP